MKLFAIYGSVLRMQRMSLQFWMVCTWNCHVLNWNLQVSARNVCLFSLFSVSLLSLCNKFKTSSWSLFWKLPAEAARSFNFVLTEQMRRSVVSVWLWSSVCSTKARELNNFQRNRRLNMTRQRYWLQPQQIMIWKTCTTRHGYKRAQSLPVRGKLPVFVDPNLGKILQSALSGNNRDTAF